ncbi:hypothetical protein J5N97_025928 [Dioscorea zingiberensis]|uniref:Uncharacterized protein n=1 Tax=Dioscorea zingiberensis TaxID=325984 RepID=A0A9D5C1G9_9LILI|nr:hypothetical protein J5N97_025928 [Dioscorea zingiberensis]
MAGVDHGSEELVRRLSQVTNANTQRDTTRITGPANIGSSEQINHQRKAAKKGKKKTVAVPKGRKKIDAACYGPVKVLRKTNPVVAEIFSLMSRDEGRDAGVEAIGQIEELLSEIYAVGGKDKGSFLGSFSKEVIETSFNVDSDEVQSLFEQKSRKLMVKATKEQISTISKAL